MKNELKVFKSTDFGNVRTITEGEKVLFVASDIAKALGYTNTNKAISDHCKGITKRYTLTEGGNQELNYIYEGDVYRLIVRSKLETAEKFETWLFDEVLPTIRKTGGYVNDDDLFLNTYLPYADEQTTLMFRATLETIRKQNQALKEKDVIIEHKEDVIIGLVDNISLADKRQILNRVVKKTTTGNYQERYAELYKQFNLKYHIDVKQRFINYNENKKPKIKNVMDYIDKVMGKIPELYDIAAKLYENDVKALASELYELNNTRN